MATRKQRAIVYRRAASPTPVPFLLEQLAGCPAYIQCRGWARNRPRCPATGAVFCGGSVAWGGLSAPAVAGQIRKRNNIHQPRR